MPSIMEDPNIHRLLLKHQVDIVMSSSSIVTLMDLIGQWEIPVTVAYPNCKLTGEGIFLLKF